MLSLLQALEDLVEASESMAATYECIRGRTPEDDDTHTHELWAGEFLAERTNAAKETINLAKHK